MMELLLQISDFLWGTVLFYSLIPIGIGFTIFLGFPQLRYFIKMWKTMFDGTTKEGGISGFKALMVSTAARVGTGNLVGVTVALTVGGPGAIFWMWVVAFFGMGTAVAENSLAQLYKVKSADGSFHGGPSTYMVKGIKGQFGKVMAILFAIATVLCYGFSINAIQANTIKESISIPFGVPDAGTAIALTVLTALIAFGGLKRLALVTQYMVPFMAVFYIILVGYVVLTNLSQVPGVFSLIIAHAFGWQEAVAGTFAYAVKNAIINGVRRGLFSNEAGLGSSPNVAATADVKHPIDQGFIQAAGVFLDTIIICSATAFVILLSGQFQMDGVKHGFDLLESSLSVFFGGATPVLLAIVVFFFAYSSIIGNFYYGEANIFYIFKDSKIAHIIYKAGVLISIALGSMASLSIWDLGDFFMAIMAIINLIAIVILSPKVIAMMRDYSKKYAVNKSPVFKASDMPGVDGLEVWK